MKPADDIERLIRRISFRAGPEMDDSLRAGIIQANDARLPAEPAPDGKSGRRWIMRISTRKIVVVTHSVGLPKTPTAGGDAAKEDGHRREDLREWASLRQQNKRQLLWVGELTANGELDLRIFTYRYQLSDGRTMEMKEDGGGKFLLSKAQRQEWTQARQTKSGEDMAMYEAEVAGHTLSFTRKRFVLSDGTELIWSVGKPKDSP